MSTPVAESEAFGMRTTAVRPSIGFRVAALGASRRVVTVMQTPEETNGLENKGLKDRWTIPGDNHLRQEWLTADHLGSGCAEFRQLHLADSVDAALGACGILCAHYKMEELMVSQLRVLPLLIHPNDAYDSTAECAGLLTTNQYDTRTPDEAFACLAIYSDDSDCVRGQL